MRTPDMFIGGLGVFLPETVSVRHAVEQGLYPAEDVELHQLAGAAVAGPVPAPEMALRAAEEAVKRYGQPPDDLDLLLYCSSWLQGPEGWLAHSHVQRHLTGGGVPAYEVRLGCNGMFGALELAADHLRADPGRRSALLVAADNFGDSPLLDRWRMGPGFIVGDAASAVILTKQPGFARLLAVRSVAIPEAEEVHRGSEPMYPPTVAAGRRTDFVARFHEITAKVTAQPDSPLGRALVKVREQLMVLVETTLAEAGITIADLSRVAFINCSAEAVRQRCMEPLGLPMSMSTWEFGRTIGHCAASDQVLSLNHLLLTGELGPGDHLLMLGTAPGVTLSAAVVKILQRPGWAQ